MLFDLEQLSGGGSGVTVEDCGAVIEDGSDVSDVGGPQGLPFGAIRLPRQRLETLAPLGHAGAERLDVRCEGELLVEGDA